jgi:hypothetical protein
VGHDLRIRRIQSQLCRNRIDRGRNVRVLHVLEAFAVAQLQTYIHTPLTRAAAAEAGHARSA